MKPMPDSTKKRTIYVKSTTVPGEKRTIFVKSTSIPGEKRTITVGVPKVAKQKPGSAPRITAEEQSLLRMYRQLARWDRNCFFLILQSLVCGRYTPQTDKMSWAEIRRNSELPNRREAA